MANEQGQLVKKDLERQQDKISEGRKTADMPS